MTINIGISMAPVARPASESTPWRAARSIMATRLLDCLNLNTEAVPSGWERFASDMAAANKAQYNEWSAKLKPLRVSGAGESDLCRYTAQCAQMGIKVEGKNLQRLYVANETAQQTRELLRHGRGNVGDDIEASDHLSSRLTQGARSFNKALGAEATRPRKAAVAVQFGAGHCGEYAMVATHVHSGYLQPGRVVEHVGSKQADHNWAEEISATGLTADDDIIIDGWGKGCPVLRKHSAFGADPAKVEPQYGYSDASGNRQFARDLLRPAPTEEYTAKFNNYEMDKDHVWAPTPVISKAFVAEVNARQESGIEKLAKMGWAVGASSQAIIAKARGNKEILIAGARRDLEQLPPLARKIEYAPPEAAQVTAL